MEYKIGDRVEILDDHIVEYGVEPHTIGTVIEEDDGDGQVLVVWDEVRWTEMNDDLDDDDTWWAKVSSLRHVREEYKLGDVVVTIPDADGRGVSGFFAHEHVARVIGMTLKDGALAGVVYTIEITQPRHGTGLLVGEIMKVSQNQIKHYSKQRPVRGDRVICVRDYEDTPTGEKGYLLQDDGSSLPFMVSWDDANNSYATWMAEDAVELYSED